VGDKIDGRQRILPYDDVLASLNDPYAMVRRIWLQRRENKVHEDASASVATATPESE
jgi:ABC-type transporter lipoprotein component MlaA